MTWSIEAYRYPIFLGAAGHLYIVLKQDGNVISRYDGLATSSEGEITPVGSEVSGDLIKAYVNSLQAPEYSNTQDHVSIFTTEDFSLIQKAESYLTSMVEYINSGNFLYKATPDFDFYNSNSAFSAFCAALQGALGISSGLIDEAKGLGIGLNPGLEQDLLRGMAWAPNLDDPSHKGYVLIDVSGYDTLIGGSGNDNLSGADGADTLTGGSGADIFVFSPGAGQDEVTDYSLSEGDKLRFSPASAVTLTSLFGERVGNDLIMHYGADDDTVKVDNFFFGIAQNSKAPVSLRVMIDDTDHELRFNGDGTL